MRLLSILPALAFAPFLQAQWTFTGDTSATWEQAIARYSALANTHPQGAHLLDIGNDDGGQPMHLFVITDGSPCDPDGLRAHGKNILWITNGIHPGEPDGIDASLMLAQALLEDDQLMGLTVHTAVCIVPVYNVSGALRRGSFSRANQTGPKEYGFRGNARNLDLNRDFMKMDSRNTWAMEKALAKWDPDIYFETHVSDGADHRYIMELLTTQKDKLDGGLSAFMTMTLVPKLHQWMDRKSMAMCPYFETKADVPDSGLIGFYDSPRYSTGFNALFDRIGILSETHMLKPYADRVNATFQLLLATLAAMDQHPDELRKCRTQAKKHTAGTDEAGLNWKVDTTSIEHIPWKGYAAGFKPSEVSGLPRLWYDHARMVDDTVPWTDSYRASLVKRKPLAYLVPQEWHEVIERLEANGVYMQRVENEHGLLAERDSIGAFSTSPAPYEGHYLHSGIHCATTVRKVLVHAGDRLVPMGRSTDRYVMEAMEPEGEDSFFSWGMFDSVLQEKEWFSDYVFEDIAASLLAKDPALKSALEAKRASDPEFAKDAWAQLYFVYQRSPWFEPSFRGYPVLRVVGE